MTAKKLTAKAKMVQGGTGKILAMPGDILTIESDLFAPFNIYVTNGENHWCVNYKEIEKGGKNHDY